MQLDTKLAFQDCTSIVETILTVNILYVQEKFDGEFCLTFYKLTIKLISVDINACMHTRSSHAAN